MGMTFNGCYHQQKKSDKEQSNYDRTLLDSIKKLDSLTFVTRLTNTNKSKQFAADALKLASKLNNPEGLILAYSAKAHSFHSSPDSEFTYLTKALKLSDQSDILTHKPNLLSNLGQLYNSAHNPKMAMLLLDSCIRLAGKMKNWITKSLAFNELGNVYNDAMDYGSAKRNYDSAYETAEKHGLIRESGFALGSLAKMEKSPGKKRWIAEQAISRLQKYESARDGLAGILINIGLTFSDPDSAIFYYRKALDISATGNLLVEEVMVYNNLAYAFLEKGKVREARSCLADHAFPLAEKMNNPELLSTIYDSYADVLSAEGEFKQAVIYEKKSIDAGTEAAKQAAADQVRLLSCMLDLKNKESAIHIKDQEISVHRKNERIFTLWLGMSGLGILLLLVLLFITRLRNKLKSERERLESSRRIIEIEESEKRKLSMELHDLSGQMKIELIEHFNRINIPEGDEKREMKIKIKSLSDHLRTISHRMSRITLKPFDIGTMIKGLCDEFREFSALDILLTKPDNLPELDDGVKLHLFRILQEILTNAVKYTRSAHIKIDLSFSDTDFIMKYSDNGQGFNTVEVNNKGLGLINIRERATILGGKALLEAEPGSGVFWEITIPLIIKKQNRIRYGS